MPKEKMEEHQGEVFVYTDGDERILAVVDKNNNIFRLEPHDFWGEATEEEKKNMKSIGIFNLY